MVRHADTTMSALKAEVEMLHDQMAEVRAAVRAMRAERALSRLSAKTAQRFAMAEEVEVGALVSIDFDGQPVYGQVVSKVTDGLVEPMPEGEVLEGTPDNPAFGVQVWSQNADTGEWEATEQITAHRADALTLIDALPMEGDLLGEALEGDMPEVEDDVTLEGLAAENHHLRVQVMDLREMIRPLRAEAAAERFARLVSEFGARHSDAHTDCGCGQSDVCACEV
jgi:hypothetical protein